MKWINFLQMAGDAPRSLKLIRRLSRSTHGLGRSVMKITSESALTEIAIFPREENKFVPSVIHDLRRHCGHVAFELVANKEVLLQSPKDIFTLRKGELPMFAREAGTYASGKFISPNELMLLPATSVQTKITVLCDPIAKARPNLHVGPKR